MSVVRRLFWTALGATAGVLVVHKVSRTARAYTPRGVADGLSGLGTGLREMAEVAREAMAERDAELRVALGVDEAVDASGPDPQRVRALIERPTADHPRQGGHDHHEPGARHEPDADVHDLHDHSGRQVRYGTHRRGTSAHSRSRRAR
ncbi:MAG: hypothetical protein ACRC35_10015 [Angustibacter sp.]